MCGRFSLSVSAQTLAKFFRLPEVPSFERRYNLTPTQSVATVVVPQPGCDRQFQWMRWGLIPSWAKDPKIGNRMINARVETVAEKPAFRNALKQRRCLVLADGFYEWQQQGKQKQPYYFQVNQGEPFAFAGLWETWQSPEDERIVSCTLITTVANDKVQPIHDRMPVILSPESYDAWLDPSLKEPQAVLSLLVPEPVEKMKTYPVSQGVNNPSFDRPDCIQPLAEKS
ncbi:MAG: SOS response-associated peptidase [Actinomycetota bacterium]